MGAEQGGDASNEASPSGTLTEGTPHRRDKGMDGDKSGSPARGCLVEVYGAVPNRAKAKHRKACVSGVSWRVAAKPDIRPGNVRSGDGVGTKFCVLTRGDLSASAHRNVIGGSRRGRRRTR